MESVLRSSPSPTTDDQAICAGCQEILIQPNKAVTDTFRFTREGRTIVLSAESGCILCQAFVSCIRRRRSIADSCWEISVYFNQHGEPFTIDIEVSGEDSLGLTIYTLTLLPTAYYSDPGSVDQRPSSQVGQGNPSPAQLALPILPSSTQHPRCMARASAWLKECSESHKRCNQISNMPTAETIPSRLLAVSTQKVKMVAASHTGDSKAPVYMTLSHKWRNPMPKLLQCNIKKLEWDVNVSKLPQLFKDVFLLAREIGIPYVWIDALCIIQDDEVDKASEISKMDHIYQNAVLNIGAIGAADAARSLADGDLVSDSAVECKGRNGMREDTNVACSTDIKNSWRSKGEDRQNAERYDWFAVQASPPKSTLELPGLVTEHMESRGPGPGLFAAREPLLYSPFAVTIKREGKEYSCIVYDWRHADDFENSALFKRGWVLQERLLSPRTLFFGQQMVWECSELVACETFPFGFPLLSEPNVRLGKILIEYKEDSKRSRQYEASHRRIIYKVSAHDEYYAGLWKKDIISGLCWFRADQEFGQYPPCPDYYRAPSWSWASVKFPVRFIRFNEAEDDETTSYVHIGRLKGIDVVPSGLDPLGRIVSARLQISGHLHKAIRSVSERNIKRMPSWTVDHQSVQYEWFDTGHEGEGFDIRDMSTAYFLLLAYAKGVLVFGPGDSLPLIEQLTGVIVEPVDDDRTTWRRIGAFHHPRGNRSMERDSSPHYPEFDDWDPTNYERHTITII